VEIAETIQSAIHNLDRYMSQLKFHSDNRQYRFCAITSLYIQSKISEADCPITDSILGLKLFIEEEELKEQTRHYETDITVDHIKLVEPHMLKLLEFRLHCVTPWSILYNLLTCYPPPIEIQSLLNCDLMKMCETVINVMHTDYSCIDSLPSTLVVSTIWAVLDYYSFRNNNTQLSVISIIQNYINSWKRLFLCDNDDINMMRTRIMNMIETQVKLQDATQIIKTISPQKPSLLHTLPIAVGA